MSKKINAAQPMWPTPNVYWTLHSSEDSALFIEMISTGPQFLRAPNPQSKARSGGAGSVGSGWIWRRGNKNDVSDENWTRDWRFLQSRERVMVRGGCGPGGRNHPEVQAGHSLQLRRSGEDRGSDRAAAKTGLTLGLKQFTLEPAWWYQWNLEVSRSCGNSFRYVGWQQTPDAGARSRRRGKVATGDLGLLLLRAKRGSGMWALRPTSQALWPEGSKESPSLGALEVFMWQWKSSTSTWVVQFIHWLYLSNTHYVEGLMPRSRNNFL